VRENDDDIERYEEKFEETEREMHEFRLFAGVHANLNEPSCYKEGEYDRNVIGERRMKLTWKAENLARVRAQLTLREEIGLNETNRINHSLVDVQRKCLALNENVGPPIVANWYTEFQTHVDIVYGY